MVLEALQTFQVANMPAHGLKLKIGLRNVALGEGTSGVRASVQTQLDSGNFLEIAQTESQFNQRHVDFMQRASIHYRFDRVQRVKIIIYGVNDALSEQLTYRLGETLCDLPVLLARQGKLALPVNNETVCDVTVEVPDFYRNLIRFRFSASHLHAPSMCPTIAPYFVMSLQLEERAIMLHRSETLSSKNPEWAEFSVPLFVMQYYQQGSIQFQVYNYFPNHEDVLIGYFSTNLIQLQRGPGGINSYMLLNHEGRRKDEKMSVDLELLEQTEGTSFFDVIMENTHIHLGVAVDFTASNGNPVEPTSLHYIHPHQPNPYLSCLLKLLPPFLGYMRDPRITAVGFGAKVQPNHELSHCFPMDSSHPDCYVNGMEGVLNAYRNARMEVLPFAPTEFADVIYHMSKFAKAASRIKMGLYFVLLVLTDGDITNPKRTKDALVDACEAPLSVVAVGLGNDSDFSKVKALESPVLKHSDGHSSTRQVLSFVPANRLEEDDAIALVPFRIQQWKLLNERLNAAVDKP